MAAPRVFILLLFFACLAIFPACEISDEDIPNPVDSRAKFMGNWKVNENCTRGNYTVYISADPGNSTQVLIENFGNPGPGYDPAVALVVSNIIKVSSQNIGEGWTVSGQGTYQSNGTVEWDYSIIINGHREDCTATYSR